MLLCVFLRFFSYAQDDILVPYRGAKGLFGLANLNGKLLMPASYSRIEPIGKGYFKFVSGAAGRETFTGVLQGTKVIIANSKHEQFFLAEEGLIVASENTYISKNSNFYNLKGEKLFEENLQKSKLLRFGSNKLMGEKSPFIALLVEDYNNRVSLVVYDCKQQKLQEPILKNVYHFDLDRNNSAGLVMACTYLDEKGASFHDIIYYDPKLKKLVKENFLSHVPKDDVTDDPGGAVIGSLDVVDDGDREVVEERIEMNKPNYIRSAKPINKRAYFTRKKDGNAIDYNNKALAIAPNEQLFFALPYDGTQQIDPLVYHKNNKWGLVFSDTFRTEPIYDSIIYLKGMGQNYKEVYYYLVGVIDEISGLMKYGILNDMGVGIIPIVYHKLLPDLLQIDIDEQNDSSFFVWKSPRIYANGRVLVFQLQPNALLLAEQNGKQGIINLQGEVVMPFLYDKIWKNTLEFLRSYEVITDFMVYQMGNNYGVFYFNRNGEVRKKTDAVFDKIPVYVYKNYMGVYDLDIYSLATANVHNYYFANAKGFKYCKE